MREFGVENKGFVPNREVPLRPIHPCGRSILVRTGCEQDQTTVGPSGLESSCKDP